MMDLGKYAFTVLTAYGAGLALLALLIAQTWLASRKARRALDEQERHD